MVNRSFHSTTEFAQRTDNKGLTFTCSQSMANKSMNSISLKALVDKRSNKVIFIETDDDFVDVLFNFLTIPMGTIIRLALEHSVPVAMGCMNNLYASVENIDASLFQSESCKDMLLCPRSGAESHCKNLKLKISNGEPTRYFLCSEDCTHRYNLFSHYKDVLCECGEPMDNEISLSVGKLKKSSFADGGVFCKGLTRFIITDDLQVMPPLSSAISSLFTKLGVMDASTTEEQAFNVGVDEVIEVLTCYANFFWYNFDSHPLLSPGFEFACMLISIKDAFVRNSAKA